MKNFIDYKKALELKKSSKNQNYQNFLSYFINNFEYDIIDQNSYMTILKTKSKDIQHVTLIEDFKTNNTNFSFCCL